MGNVLRRRDLSYDKEETDVMEGYQARKKKLKQFKKDRKTRKPKLPVRDKVFAAPRPLYLGETEEEKDEEEERQAYYSQAYIHVESYLHPVTEAQAALLTGSGSACPFQDIKQQTGAYVEFDPYPSNAHGRKFVIILGSRRQIRAAVRLINQMTGVQESLLAQAQAFWLQWVEEAFPELDSRAYFLPPVYVNRVPMTRQLVAGLNAQILHSPPGQAGQPSHVQGNMSSPGQAGQPSPGQSGQYQAPAMGVSQPSIPQPPTVQDSDVRDDTAMQRVLLCLQKMSEENKEVLFGMSQLQFGQYLGEPCYAAAADQLPLSSNLLPALPRNWKQGDFDVLLFHRHYGLVVCEVKSFGQNVSKLSMSQQDIDNNIRKKLKEAVSQLRKAEAMLSHLVSDIAPGLRITKTIGLPNLTAGQIQQAVSSDPRLTGNLCRCLETKDPADIPGLCLCSDQLSDPKTPWDVSSHVLTEFRNWWQRRVAGAGPDSHMTCDVYKKLVARFCGPATTVTVTCTSLPRVAVKTLDQAVSLTGEYYVAHITLFPEQVQLLTTAPATVFIAGPPGTGKSVVLLLKGAEWLRRGEYVYIVSIGNWSRAACCMLYHMLLQHVNTQQAAGASSGQPHLLQYDFADNEDVEKAVNDLSQVANGRPLYVIVDEASNDFRSEFKIFFAKLLTQVPLLHLWAASCYPGDAPAGWQVEYLTRPLRSPPAVVREVAKDEKITKHQLVPAYTERGVPDYTDGPPIKQLYHRGQGHSGNWPDDCVTCGREVASFLLSLHVGFSVDTPTSATVSATSASTRPAPLQWKDVLVLHWYVASENSGVVTAFSEAGIPVRVMEDDDIEDVATARSDVVWVADGGRVRGLERKIIVCLESRVEDFSDRLYCMSRCTSQLVIVSPDNSPPEHE